MIATLRFKLPEEKDEFTMAHKGGSYFCALYEINELIFAYKNPKADEVKPEGVIDDIFVVLNQLNLDEVS